LLDDKNTNKCSTFSLVVCAHHLMVCVHHLMVCVLHVVFCVHEHFQLYFHFHLIHHRLQNYLFFPPNSSNDGDDGDDETNDNFQKSNFFFIAVLVYCEQLSIHEFKSHEFCVIWMSAVLWTPTSSLFTSSELPLVGVIAGAHKVEHKFEQKEL